MRLKGAKLEEDKERRADSHLVVYRFGLEWESKEDFERQSKEATMNGFPRGVQPNIACGRLFSCSHRPRGELQGAENGP